MIILKTEFNNCYGIRELKFDFDFSSGSTYVIYSPNGTMKTSFANTFMDFSQSKDSKDRVFKQRVTERLITNESDDELTASEIFVIQPYNESFKSEKISTLLVNNLLREQYENIYEELNERKDYLVKALKPLSGLKNGLEETFSFDFTNYPDDFFKALLRVKSEVNDGEEPEFSDIQYI